MSATNTEKLLKTYNSIHLEGSNPSLSAINELITSKLEKLPYKKTDNIEKLYKDPKIYNARGNISKDWNIYYSYRNPDTGKFERIPYSKGINIHKTVATRTEVCKTLVTVFSEILKEGFNPFIENTLVKSDYTLSGCIRTYILYITSSNLSFNTTKQYILQLNIFKQFCQSISIDKLHLREITKSHITEFKQHLKVDRKIEAGKTINNYINTIRTFFNYFIDNFDGIIEKSPAKKIKSEKQILRGNKAYTDSELNLIKKNISENDPYLWQIFELVYYAALRPESEAIHIKIGDLDLDNDLIYVCGDISKGRENQVIPMYPELKNLLINWGIKSYPDDYFLFGKGDQPHSERVSAKNFTKRFLSIKKPLGFGKEYGIYSMKPTRACHLYDDGAEIRDIQLLFRHKTPLITMTYMRSLSRIERGRNFDKGREI